MCTSNLCGVQHEDLVRPPSSEYMTEKKKKKKIKWIGIFSSDMITFISYHIEDETISPVLYTYINRRYHWQLSFQLSLSLSWLTDWWPRPIDQSQRELGSYMYININTHTQKRHDDAWPKSRPNKNPKKSTSRYQVSARLMLSSSSSLIVASTHIIAYTYKYR